jgi:hypothetical protein
MAIRPIKKLALLGAEATMMGARLRNKNSVLATPATSSESQDHIDEGNIQKATAGIKLNKEYPNKQNMVEKRTLGSYCFKMKYTTNGTPKR